MAGLESNNCAQFVVLLCVICCRTDAFTVIVSFVLLQAFNSACVTVFDFVQSGSLVHGLGGFSCA